MLIRSRYIKVMIAADYNRLLTVLRSGNGRVMPVTNVRRQTA